MKACIKQKNKKKDDNSFLFQNNGILTTYVRG